MFQSIHNISPLYLPYIHKYMDEDFSDYDTNSSILESFRSSSFTFTNKLPECKLLYKKDKTCICCKSVFGTGLIHAKRHFCKFCYRGICAKCSPSVAFHPDDKKLLRICNLCCERTVTDKFSEVFQSKIIDAQDQKIRCEEEILNTREEIQGILQDIYRMELLMQMEKDKSEEVEEKFSDTPALFQSKQQVGSRLQELLSKSNQTKGGLAGKDSDLRELMSDYGKESANRSENRAEISRLRNKLSELQDEFMHARSRSKKKNVVLSGVENKEQQELNRLAINNFELQEGNKAMVEEIERILEENEGMSKKIKTLKLENQSAGDKLVNNERHAYSAEEEERIRVMKFHQREKQAVIEQLRLELRLVASQQRNQELGQEFENRYEEEDAAIKNNTRPCARCSLF